MNSIALGLHNPTFLPLLGEMLAVHPTDVRSGVPGHHWR